MHLLPPELVAIAATQHGALSIRSITASGIRTRSVQRWLDAGLWQQPTSRVVITSAAAPTRLCWLWVAVLHFDGFGVGGCSALELHGLQQPLDGRIHLVGPRGGWGTRLDTWSMHSAQGLALVQDAGLPRVDDATAVVQSMRWAKSLRQAIFYAVWSIQRGIVTLDELRDAVLTLPPSPTASMARRAIVCIEPGVHSMNEHDFAQECRRRGIPEPVRQTRRVDSEGRDRYLDAEFRVNGHSLVVEIDGLQHLDTAVRSDDEYRANELTLQQSSVLRVSSLTLRTKPDRFFDQLQRGLQQLALAA